MCNVHATGVDLPVSFSGMPVPRVEAVWVPRFFFDTGEHPKTIKQRVMKQLKANIALSLDGFIACIDGDISWIPRIVSKAIQAGITQADTLLMGANTCNEIFERNGYWLFKDKTTCVASRYSDNTAIDESVHFLGESPMKTIFEMKQQPDANLLAVGGGIFISSLIDNELLDILSIYTVPVILKTGIPFLRTKAESKWKTLQTEKIDNVIHILYEFEKSI
jgi:dihydrofolate reductase